MHFHTKLLREIFPLEMSVSTKPAKVGLYKSGLRDDLLDARRKEGGKSCH
jgi:hypothetical protein